MQANVPRTMQAAVYRAPDDVRTETVPVPEIGPGEVLVRMDTCGVCGTDLKKIHTGSHSAPRVFGHEMAGTIAAIGAGVKGFSVGDRVMAFHHVPCGECFTAANIRSRSASSTNASAPRPGSVRPQAAALRSTFA
jgi:L-iditol 2-dehydrogenase